MRFNIGIHACGAAERYIILYHNATICLENTSVDGEQSIVAAMHLAPDNFQISLKPKGLSFYPVRTTVSCFNGGRIWEHIM